MSAGHVRVNGERVKKPSSNIKAGDGLSFMQSRDIRIVRITTLGDRRGPAAEAQTLYEDLTPAREAAAAPIERVGIRPTKKDRRALDSLRHTDS